MSKELDEALLQEIETLKAELAAARENFACMERAGAEQTRRADDNFREIERLRALCAMEILQKDDGLWLSIKAPSGKSALIRLHEAPTGSIVDSVLHEMAAGRGEGKK